MTQSGAKRNPEDIRASLAAAIESGKIRPFAEQSEGVAAGVQCTELETKARRMYLQYILLTENPRTLP